jgi:hypothetical protein
MLRWHRKIKNNFNSVRTACFLSLQLQLRKYLNKEVCTGKSTKSSKKNKCDVKKIDTNFEISTFIKDKESFSSLGHDNIKRGNSQTNLLSSAKTTKLISFESHQVGKIFNFKYLYIRVRFDLFC